MRATFKVLGDKTLYRCIWIFPLLVLLTFCNGKNKPSNDHILESSINFSNNEISSISKIVSSIEYFVLPSNSSISFVDKAIRTKGFYVLGDFDLSKSLTVLNEKLELVGNIQNYGEGPSEYQHIQDFTINREENTVDVLSINKLGLILMENF
ncbi:hypothetical protein DN752_14470 [Echinicola strongylocentroti]|uniref:Uncharacterized protein n=1 Tax=Echinicola strongylocentroti TaxID=1795355 RepID=A0A2Z4IKJ5_9BACT|nr:6-bladed beta-propeller [Echinicola strongylocentroti]AWW31229.1 hypothetical protein DN752_14470 [Echinicola strongylocentroti]